MVQGAYKLKVTNCYMKYLRAKFEKKTEYDPELCLLACNRIWIAALTVVCGENFFLQWPGRHG